ncbi:MAG TPA: glycerophosphodiester phosphodiesterase [Polyangia bacterium]|nr:glycerophosphodiester phosphodiesterase [Polyangia bacterium]
MGAVRLSARDGNGARWHRGPVAPPLVWAHRGASADALENTLTAFRLARTQGADGVELDVTRCKSGEVIVFHDDDLRRLGKRPERVRDLPWSELQRIDLGGGEHMPLLDDVLAELGTLAVNIELKTAPTWQERVVDDGLAAEVAALVARHDAADRVIVSSFDPLLLGRFRLRAPQIATGLLFAHDQARPNREAWLAPVLKPTALHPEGVLVDARNVRRWHARGYAVNVWTVDDPAELRLLSALGVDGVITNRPAATRAVIQ